MLLFQRFLSLLFYANIPPFLAFYKSTLNKNLFVRHTLRKADRLQSIFDLFVCLVFTFSYIIIRNCLIFFMPFSSPQFIHVSTSLNPYLSFSSGITIPIKPVRDIIHTLHDCRYLIRNIIPLTKYILLKS